jgi:predicted DNA-binding protein
MWPALIDHWHAFGYETTETAGKGFPMNDPKKIKNMRLSTRLIECVEYVSQTTGRTQISIVEDALSAMFETMSLSKPELKKLLNRNPIECNKTLERKHGRPKKCKEQ